MKNKNKHWGKKIKEGKVTKVRKKIKHMKPRKKEKKKKKIERDTKTIESLEVGRKDEQFFTQCFNLYFSIETNIDPKQSK